MYVYSCTRDDINECLEKGKNSLLAVLEREGLLVNAEKLSKRYYVLALQTKKKGTDIITTLVDIDTEIPAFTGEPVKENGELNENKDR